jgi:coproporphyrinogen dehydrogenase HemZ
LYKIYLNRVNHPYEMREMIRMFMPSSAFEIIDKDPLETGETDFSLIIRIPNEIEDKNRGKQYLYDSLASLTGLKPEWGILTGVRPVKLAGEMIRGGLSLEETKSQLGQQYSVGPSKADLLIETWKAQQKALENPIKNSIGLYIGIPFCPSRCLYCSFPSYEATSLRTKKYLEALWKEIAFVSKEVANSGWTIESIYVGGGTPTTLSASELSCLLETVHGSFSLDEIREFTIEAGRPDTISREKLKVMRKYGVDRISINPQSMKLETLEAIGRAHLPEDIIRAFEIAREMDFTVINADLIAGLPGEELDDFMESLETIISLRPENLTVHTLAVKRASKLAEIDDEYSYHQGKRVGLMLEKGSTVLKAAGYHPYYLYRQKQMTGNHENVGYTLPGKESLYNIRIMEENQTIVAMGAGGISKVWYPEDNRLERIPNVSNYEIYIERIDEMIQRKQDHMFRIRGGYKRV